MRDWDLRKSERFGRLCIDRLRFSPLQAAEMIEPHHGQARAIWARMLRDQHALAQDQALGRSQLPSDQKRPILACDEADIRAFVDRWLDGQCDDLDDLKERLLHDQDWWADHPISDHDVGRASLADMKACHIIESMLSDLPITPLNLARVENWRASTGSMSAYEALLTRFASVLSPARRVALMQEAEDCFTPELAALWHIPP